jgi:hypothetical protein
MSFLKIDYNQAGSGDYELVAEGEYECIISDCEIKESSKGSPMIKATITIRKDVKQPHGKQKLWDYYVVSEKAMFKFQQVAKAVGLPNGKDFATLEDFRNAILYKPVRINVIQEDNTYNGETKKQARIKSYSLATVEYATPASADPFATNSGADEVDFL